MEGQCCHEGADGWTCHLVIARHWQHRSRRGVRYTSLSTTISHDNNNHRTSKHASKSWRSGGSPSCLGGSSHGWVPVKTHSTPVPTSVGRLGCSLAPQHTPMSPRKRNTITTVCQNIHVLHFSIFVILNIVLLFFLLPCFSCRIFLGMLLICFLNCKCLLFFGLG